VRSCTATGAERRQRDRLADFRRRRRIDQDLPVFGRAADVAAPFLADATDAAARDLHRQPYRTGPVNLNRGAAAKEVEVADISTQLPGRRREPQGAPPA